MYKIGEYNNLRVVRSVDFGFYLGTDEEAILLPILYAPEGLSIGDDIDVFVYTDSEDRPIATTQTPTAVVGDIVCLDIVDINRTGAFLNWGISKDLFLPFGKQRRRFEAGEKIVVKVLFDDVSERVIATSKIAAPYEVDSDELSPGQKVDVMVLDTYDTGMRVLVNNKYSGMIFHSEIVEPLTIGQEFVAYLKQIRPDTKLDISIKPHGHHAVPGDQGDILDLLSKAGGSLPYNAKTESDIIRDVFKLSKKSFKKVVGTLYKEKKIQLEDNGIRLI